jgi:protein-tyrosine phosphatase
MLEDPERFLRFERCFNFRDLGGYAGRDGRSVRWRRLFRSMTPQHMTDADARAVAGLKIGLVIDFRGERFPHSGPVLTLGGSRLPLSPATMLREGPDYERYRVAPADEALPQLLERYGEQFGAALTAIAERPDSNVLFHCRLGKDRTGVFAALVLKLLGVDNEDVVRDYMLTGDDYTLARGLLNEVEPQENHDNEPIVVREPPSLEGIEGVLKALESRYGGAHAYFGELGVREDLIEAFVEGVLEPASDETPRPHLREPVSG